MCSKTFFHEQPEAKEHLEVVAVSEVLERFCGIFDGYF
jgi:hypothetical protein